MIRIAKGLVATVLVVGCVGLTGCIDELFYDEPAVKNRDVPPPGAGWTIDNSNTMPSQNASNKSRPAANTDAPKVEHTMPTAVKPVTSEPKNPPIAPPVSNLGSEQ